MEKKGTLDYQISSAYQINIQFEMTFRDKLKLTNNKKSGVNARIVSRQ